MSITVQQLLRKIEQELAAASNSSNEARVRERIQAIKALCELALENNEGEQRSSITMPPQPMAGYTPIQQLQPVPIQQQKRMEIDQEANGDSLFDF